MFTLPLIKKEKGKPLYVSLYEMIKNDIITHALDSQEKLPSKRKLATMLGVSLKTVENAYEQLELEGFIYSVEKKGYFVENLNQYVAKSNVPSGFDGTKYVERQYRVNLRANRNAKDDFPENLWCHLIRETLLEEGSKLFDVVPFNGVYKLRKEIAKHLREFRGMEVSPDQIIIGAGTEYLYSRLKQMFGENCIYGLPNPSTKRLHELYENNGLKMVSIDMTEDGPDISQLEKYDCNVAHLSPAHQYPLGCAMLIHDRVELLKWANRKSNRYIIEDDYDSEYVVIGKPIPPLYSVSIRHKVIYMNTFSKSVGPAVRISYMVLPEELMQKYMETMSFYSCTVASLEQYTLARFIEKKHLERSIHKMNRKNMRIRDEFLEKLKPLFNTKRVINVSGNAGAHFLLKLDIEMTDQEIKNFLRERDIIVSMLSEYYIKDAEKHTGILVINYAGVSSEQIEYFVNALSELLTF